MALERACKHTARLRERGGISPEVGSTGEVRPTFSLRAARTLIAPAALCRTWWECLFPASNATTCADRRSRKGGRRRSCHTTPTPDDRSTTLTLPAWLCECPAAVQRSELRRTHVRSTSGFRFLQFYPTC